MIVIGLTGSIGMGKSTIAAMFARLGAAVCDSDKLVHELLGEKGGAVEEVGKLFPGVREGNSISRIKLGKEVFSHPEKLKMLERILHPMVHHAQDPFIRRARVQDKKLVVLDIPLLFETKGELRCDYTVVAHAPAFLQRQRVLKRPHMSEEKLTRILNRQLPAHEKRKRADFVVPTGLGKYESLKAVKRIIARLRASPSTCF
jgi:dephospho-CoA kinase